MSQEFPLDDLDKKIMNLLREDARIPFLEVAKQCSVSGAAIHQRVQRLKRIGVVQGSKFYFNPKRLGYHTCAYVGVFLDRAGLVENVLKQMKEILEITECHYTTGAFSMFIKVYAKDNDHLRQVLGEKLQDIRGIARTETFISLEAMIDRDVPVE